MFVQSYRYSFPKQYLSSWRRITRLANAVYKEYGDVRLDRLISRKENVVKVVELEYYPSRRAFIRVNKLAEKDERLIKLHELLKRFVKKKNIITESYESI